MKQEKTGRWISSSYDGTYDCFIDNTYGHTYGYISFRRNKNIIIWCAKYTKRHILNLNYFRHFLLFISAASGCDLISAFPSSVGISVGIASSVLGLKICEITAEIKKYKWIIKKKKKTDDKIVLLAKQR